MIRGVVSAAIALVCFLAFNSAASAAVVTGRVIDPREAAAASADLGEFRLRYDDAGTLEASFRFHELAAGDFSLVARVGVWNGSACDVTSTAAVTLTLGVASGVPSARYDVVNHGVLSGTLQPPGADGVWLSTLASGVAFGGRGYNCVSAVSTSGGDTADGFCMSPSGSVGCRVPPITIRWVSPRQGDTVGGVLNEGPCLAQSEGPVVRTENFVDGQSIGQQVNYPWGCEWDTRRFPDGPHTLTVRAFAADGRSVEDSVSVVVDNSRPVPAAPNGLRGIPGDGQVHLDWEDSQDLRPGDAYQVYINDRLVAERVTQSAYTARGLINGVGYGFRVSAGALGSYGPWTDPPLIVEAGEPPVEGQVVDRDGDGVAEADDCDDSNPAIHPDAPEALGNVIDENCDGRHQPYPVVGAGLNLDYEPDRVRRRLTFTRLNVNRVRRGDKLRLSCLGRCSSRLKLQRTVGPVRDALNLNRAIARGWAAVGTTLVVRIDRAGASSRIFSFRVRPLNAPTTVQSDRVCVLPDGAGKDDDCDGFRDLPVLRAAVKLDTAERGRRTLLRSLRVTRLRGGEVVTSVCRGAGCTPALTSTTSIGAGTSRFALQVRGIRLTPRASLELTISKPGFVTRVFRWTMRAGRAPSARRQCVDTADGEPLACPSLTAARPSG